MEQELTADKALSNSYTDKYSVERVISADLSTTFNDFHEYVWVKNGGIGPKSWTRIVVAGDENYNGETRIAVLAKEKILRVEPDKEIVYSVIGGMPFSEHVGIVTFTPEGSDKTKITWNTKYTPYWGVGIILKGIIAICFWLFLYNLEKLELEKKSQKKE